MQSEWKFLLGGPATENLNGIGDSMLQAAWWQHGPIDSQSGGGKHGNQNGQ